jgi:outer membrane protein TolC
MVRIDQCTSAFEAGSIVATITVMALAMISLMISPLLSSADSPPLLAAPAQPQSLSTTSTSSTARPVLEANPDSALAVTLAGFAGEYMALEQAVAVALRQGSDARIAEAELAAARASLRREKGAFDPELFGQAQWAGSDQPTASFFSGADVLQTDQRDMEAGARMDLPLGTELTASLTTSRLTTNSAFASLSPQYETYGQLAFRQPLLKGFGPAAHSDLTFAGRNLDAARQNYEQVLLTVRASVEVLYWQLYTAERDLAVALLIRDRAVAFLDEAKLRAQVGLVGPNQVANAQVFLAEQEQVVLDREEQLDRISDRLASVIGRRPQDGQGRFRPLDEPPRVFPDVDQDVLVAHAIQQNLNLQALASQVDALRGLERGARWDALPTLDLFGSIGGNGLAGTPQDIVFPGSADTLRTKVSGGFGESWAQVRDRDYPTWNVGFVFALPLGNRSDGGERDRLHFEVAKAEQQLAAAEWALEEEVRAQHRDLVRSRQRLGAASQGVSASIEQVRIGMLEYKNGRATAFEVVRLAADLATAQQRYSEALVRTARAAAELRRLTANWYPDQIH